MSMIEGSQDKDRLYIVQKMIVNGFSSRTIRDWLGKEYGIGRSQQYKVLRAARLDLAEHFQTQKDELLAINNERLDLIYEKTFMEGDYKNSLKTVDLVNKMNGIYNVEQEKPETDKVIRIKFGE